MLDVAKETWEESMNMWGRCETEWRCFLLVWNTWRKYRDTSVLFITEQPQPTKFKPRNRALVLVHTWYSPFSYIRHNPFEVIEMFG